MILYLDTSSLIKLYVQEEGSTEVRDVVERARLVATSVLAYAETRSALARLERGNFLNAEEGARLRESFETDWHSILRLQVTEELCRQAGDLAEKHGLRGFDSVHLATFLHLQSRAKTSVGFSAFDAALSRAAQLENEESEAEEHPETTE